MVNSNISLPIESLLKAHPKVAERVEKSIERSLTAFQKMAGGMGGFGEMTAFDKALLRQACAASIQVNPRILYDIFDEMGVYISVFLNQADTWTYGNNISNTSGDASTRVEAEAKAFEHAFKSGEEIL